MLYEVITIRGPGERIDDADRVTAPDHLSMTVEHDHDLPLSAHPFAHEFDEAATRGVGIGLHQALKSADLVQQVSQVQICYLGQTCTSEMPAMRQAVSP